MAEGPIPWDSVCLYAQHNGLDGDETDRLLYLVRAMDSEYLNHRSKKAKK